MREFLDGVRADIPKALESKEYEIHKGKVSKSIRGKTAPSLPNWKKEAGGKGFTIQRTVSGLVMVPQKEGRNYTQEEYEALSAGEKEGLDATGQELTEKLNDVLRQVRDNEKGSKEALAKTRPRSGAGRRGEAHGAPAGKIRLEPQGPRLPGGDPGGCHPQSGGVQPQSQPQSPIPGLKFPHQEPNFDRYGVNVFVDNTENRGAPVVFEPNPTYNNLFGRLEHEMQMGGVATTNFTMIKPGALHRANGGYLIVDAREVLINPFVWDALKRCIATPRSRSRMSWSSTAS